MKVFVDSSAFCALAIPKDTHNIDAKLIYNKLNKLKAPFYTSDYVLDEVYTLLKSRSSHKTSVKFMENIERGKINIIRITENIEKEAKTIFKKFDDKRLSFTDCSSFALINQFGIDSVFAFDKHFRYHHYSHPVQSCEL